MPPFGQAERQGEKPQHGCTIHHVWDASSPRRRGSRPISGPLRLNFEALAHTSLWPG